MIFPAAVGKGKRLFGDDAVPAAFPACKVAASSTRATSHGHL